MIRNLSILLVEDDDVAAESVTRSLRKVNQDIQVIVAENGKEAIEIMEERHQSKSLTKPYLVLLDLNMPVMNGFEFLDYVRQSTTLKNAVIFVLTTSNEDNDRSKAYHNNVAGYMVKSSVGPQFAKLAFLLDAYKAAIEPVK